MNKQSEEDTYWSDVQDFSARLKKANLLAGEKFMMHTLNAVQDTLTLLIVAAAVYTIGILLIGISEVLL